VEKAKQKSKEALVSCKNGIVAVYGDIFINPAFAMFVRCETHWATVASGLLSVIDTCDLAS
jgi:hypothetical protein